jgi:tyrosinase
MERSALALGATGIPLDLFAQSTLMVRPEWQTFKTTPRYDSLLKAITLMKANTNAADPNSWQYWKNIHVQNCPHGVPYFFAWHRGYLYYFERRLRTVSGDSQLVLPYWDYYTYSTMPAEFTNPNNGNPLYASRLNTNVRQALTLAPFASTIINFQRGLSNAFEPSCEDMPHNPIHDLIGNTMATMESPLDPIFWLHHANIDRLWVAWISAGGGRKMPLTSSSYWSGKHIYNSSLNIARLSTYGTRTSLGYRYASESMPTKIPLAQISSPNIRRVQSAIEQLMESIPAIGSFRMSGPRQTSKETYSLSGALDVGLDEKSLSVQLPASSEHSRALANIGLGKTASIPGVSEVYRSAHIALDGIELSELGKMGGFFYQIYLNIPTKSVVSKPPRSIFIGTLGAFKIAGAMHHEGARAMLRYPIRRALANATADELSSVSVSFVRINGDRSPKGGLIGVGEIRLEVTTEDAD